MNHRHSRCNAASDAKTLLIPRQPSAWVAIDDDAADWPPHTAANFVASDPTYGLSAPQVYLELQQKLEAQFGAQAS
ncbi:HAD domain-containing protein [Hydrogenophaga sp. OTU3427]|uniref:HAD domain-containing protein n=1 Tax=Hydrogenophaga sp. OTU3427 TaxID=3043856 RepID=UPI00406C8D89